MRVRAIVLSLVAGALSLTLLASASALTRPPLVQRKLDLRSATPLAPDAVGVEAPAGGIGGGATGGGPPPRIGDNVIVNGPQIGQPVGLVGRAETSITLDGQNLVAGWNDADGFCGLGLAPCTGPGQLGLSGYGYSTDGGKTWTDGGAPPAFDGILTSGDPWLDNNGAGTFYYANLGLDEELNSIGISVHRGNFSGGSFSWTDATSFDSPNNAVIPGADFYDKEALVAGKNQNKNDAYVSLTNFLGQPFIGPPPGCGTQLQFGFGQIEVWRTHDGGDTWQGPAVAGPERPDSVASCGNEGTLQQSSAPAVGPNGDLYVVWQLGPTFSATGATSADADIAFAKSTDGGVTFSAPSKVADINSSRANPPVGYNRDRINDHPRIDVATTGKNKGRVYAVYYSSGAPVVSPPANPASCLVPPAPQLACRAQTLTSSQVFLKYSDDQGATWSPAMELGGPVPASGVKRFWPDVSVSPGGNVHVVYYESQEKQATPNPSDVECNINVGGSIRRQGLNSSLVDTWWTYSSDGGITFSMPLKLSTATSNWCTTASNIRPNFGDYIDAVAGGNRILGTWADGRAGVPDTFFAAGLGAGKSTP